MIDMAQCMIVAFHNRHVDPQRCSGPLQRVEDLTTPPVVGGWYLVPCVTVRDYRKTEGVVVVPVLGTAHEDPDLGAPYVHLHFDQRFLEPLKAGMNECWPQIAVRVVNLTEALAPIEHVAMVCRRDQPTYPADIPSPSQDDITNALIYGRDQHALCAITPHTPGFLPGLEDRTKGRCSRFGICAHRGTPLSNLPVTKLQGRAVRVCPSHGLAWDVETGQLVKRTSLQ